MSLVLTGLDGNKPIGFLAAVGVLNLLHLDGQTTARLSWRPSDGLAILTGSYSDIDALSEKLFEVAASAPEGGVLPVMPADFPALAGAEARFKVSRSQLREMADHWADEAQSQVLFEQWLSSLVTDTVISDGVCERSLYVAGVGQQTMRTMFKVSHDHVISNRERLREALAGWRRQPGVTGESLDSEAMFDAANSGDGRVGQMRGVPGATWLALMAFPLFLTTGGRNGVETTTGWHQISPQRARQLMVYVLWTNPLGPYGISALLEHPAIARVGRPVGPIEPSDAALRALSVFRVCAGERQLPEGAKSAGILTPAGKSSRSVAQWESIRKPRSGSARATPGRRSGREFVV